VISRSSDGGLGVVVSVGVRDDGMTVRVASVSCVSHFAMSVANPGAMLVASCGTGVVVCDCADGGAGAGGWGEAHAARHNASTVPCAISVAASLADAHVIGTIPPAAQRPRAKPLGGSGLVPSF